MEEDVNIFVTTELVDSSVPVMMATDLWVEVTVQVCAHLWSLQLCCSLYIVSTVVGGTMSSAQKYYF